MSNYENYKIVSNHNYPELETEVDELIENGWMPTGGVTHVQDNDRPCRSFFLQAMVKS